MDLPQETLDLLKQHSNLTEEEIIKSLKQFEDDPRPLWWKLSQPLHSGQCKTTNIVEAFSQPIPDLDIKSLMSGWKDEA